MTIKPAPPPLPKRRRGVNFVIKRDYYVPRTQPEDPATGDTTPVVPVDAEQAQ